MREKCTKAVAGHGNVWRVKIGRFVDRMELPPAMVIELKRRLFTTETSFVKARKLPYWMSLQTHLYLNSR